MKHHPLRHSLVLAAMLASAIPVEARQGVPTPIANRTLAFDAREGTWMAPSLSPDGQTILFDLLGDIYAVAATGGDAWPVLRGSAFEMQPVWSPDGTRFVFVSDRSGVNNLWVANADGSNPVRVSDEDDATILASPAWSSDGRHLYASRIVHDILSPELYRWPAIGGAGERITDANRGMRTPFDDRHNALGAVASADGRYLYYAVKTGSLWTRHPLPHWSIARRDVASGKEEIVVQTAGGAMRPALSRDGRLLAYASRNGRDTGLRLRDLDSGADRWVVPRIDHDAQEGGYYVDLVPRIGFTPDDRAIVTSIDGGMKRIDLADGRVHDIPFVAPVRVAVGAPTRVAQREETGDVRVRVIQTPRLSPDGRMIVFAALGRLYVQSTRPASRPHAVRGVQGMAYQPAWSPDGRTLAYVTWSGDSGGDIWRIPAGGGTARRITRSSDYFTEPTFSQDGRTLYALHASKADRQDRAMEVTPDRATDIVALSLDNGERRLIAHVRGAIALGLGDDGRLRFTSPAGIESIAPDGNGRRIELKVEAPNPNRYFRGMNAPEEARLSPDGRRVLVKAGSQLWLAEVPVASGEAPPVVRVGVTDTAARRLTQVGADAIAWAPDGRRLLWSVGATIRIMAHDAVTPVPERDAARIDATIRLPRAVPTGRMLLRGATVLTMRGAEVIENADLLIDRDRIAAIGPYGSVPVPARTEIIDVAGRFVMPGLVDAHAHWFEMRRGVQEAGHWDFRANLALGVTAGLDVQPFTTDVFGYQDMIDAGIMDGPRAWSTGPGLFLNQAPANDADADAILSRYRDHYRTRNLKSYMIGGRTVRQRVVAAARRMGMMPTTEGASDHVLGLTHALDGFAGNEHNLPLAPLRDDVIRLIVASGISYVPTLSVLYGGAPALPNMLIKGDPLDDPHVRASYPEAMIAAKRRDRRWTPPQDIRVADFAADTIRLQRAGGLVGMGSHGEVQGIGMHLEMKAYTLGGASPQEALYAATMGSARTIGHADDVGSIESGKFADLLILSKDPRIDIDNSRAIVDVFKGGVRYRDGVRKAPSQG